MRGLSTPIPAKSFGIRKRTHKSQVSSHHGWIKNINTKTPSSQYSMDMVQTLFRTSQS